MHDCRRCGRECCCSGDIDDCHVMSDAWVWAHCVCCDECMEADEEEFDILADDDSECEENYDYDDC